MLSAGDLVGSIDKSATFLSPNQFTVTPSAADKLSLTISPTTGMIGGSFVHPVTGKVTAVHAVLLQEEDVAAGFFLGPSDSGAVQLSAVP